MHLLLCLLLHYSYVINVVDTFRINYAMMDKKKLKMCTHNYLRMKVT